VRLSERTLGGSDASVSPNPPELLRRSCATPSSCRQRTRKSAFGRPILVARCATVIPYMPEPDYADEWLTRLYTARHCRWCKHPFEPVKRRGLCGHCYRLDLKMAKTYRNVTSGPQPPHWLAVNQLFDAAAQVHLAKGEGERYGDIHARHVSGFQLEQEIVFVISALIDQRYLEGYATSLGRALPPAKRRFVFHLFSLLSRAHLRKNRPSLSGQFIQQTIKERERLVQEWLEAPRR